MLAGLDDFVRDHLHPSARRAFVVDWDVDSLVFVIRPLDEEKCVDEIDLRGRHHTNVDFHGETDFDLHFALENALALAVVSDAYVRLVEALLLHLFPEPLHPVLVREGPVVLVVRVAVVVTVEEAEVVVLRVFDGRRWLFRSVLVAFHYIIIIVRTAN
jgi:hypothetical protein